MIYSYNVYTYRIYMYTYQAIASKLYLHYKYIYWCVCCLHISYIPIMTLMKLSEKTWIICTSWCLGVIPPDTEAGLDHLMYKVGHQLGVRGDPKVEIRWKIWDLVNCYPLQGEIYMDLGNNVDVYMYLFIYIYTYKQYYSPYPWILVVLLHLKLPLSI